MSKPIVRYPHTQTALHSAVSALHLLVMGAERTRDVRAYLGELRRLTLHAGLDVVRAGLAGSARSAAQVLATCERRMARVAFILELMLEAVPATAAIVARGGELTRAARAAMQTFEAELAMMAANAVRPVFAIREDAPARSGGAIEGEQAPAADPAPLVREPTAELVPAARDQQVGGSHRPGVWTHGASEDRGADDHVGGDQRDGAPEGATISGGSGDSAEEVEPIERAATIERVTTIERAVTIEHSRDGEGAAPLVDAARGAVAAASIC